MAASDTERRKQAVLEFVKILPQRLVRLGLGDLVMANDSLERSRSKMRPPRSTADHPSDRVDPVRVGHTFEDALQVTMKGGCLFLLRLVVDDEHPRVPLEMLGYFGEERTLSGPPA